MTDDARTFGGDEHAPEVAIGAHRDRRVIGQGEQSGELIAASFKPVDCHIRHCGLVGPV
jgi:hypothetical protein